MLCFSPVACIRRWYFLFVFLFLSVWLTRWLTMREKPCLSCSPLILPRGTMPGTEEVLHKCLSAEWIAVFHIPALIAIPTMCLGGAQSLVDSGESHHDLDSQLFTTVLCINFECRQLGSVPWADKGHVCLLVNRVTAREGKLVTEESWVSSCAKQGELWTLKPPSQQQGGLGSMWKEPGPHHFWAPGGSPVLRLDARVAQWSRYFGLGIRAFCVSWETKLISLAGGKRLCKL